MDQRIANLICLLACYLLQATTVCAQYNLGFSEAPDQLVFDQNGNTTRFGAAGGFNTPQFSEIDLNGDGHMDLFSFDRNNDIVRTFVYDPVDEDYNYAPSYESAFPADLKEFALLRDYDCDGDQDIFTYYLAGFRVYKNLGTTPPSFEKVTDKIRSDYGSITTGAFVLAGDIPAIDDIDGDGDLDILAFGTVNSENTIEYHRNVSQELYNSCDSLQFEVVTQCWGNVEEPANSATLAEVNCKGIVPPPGRETLHPGSSILVFDAQNDGDQDLVVGDIQTDRVVFAINEGDATTATIDVNQQTNDFPNAVNPVRMQYLIAGYKVDVDHDGVFDLLMSVNNTIDSSVNTSHVWHYRNTSSGAPAFELSTKEFLIGDMLDLGANVSVVAHDVDEDGDQDLLISNDYRRTPTGNSRSRIFLFTQQSNGQFQLTDDDFAGLSAFGFDAADIALGDMDGDGDADMILGDQDGLLHYFQNNPSGGMMQLSLSQPIYMGINSIGANASPEIADVNGDGLPDLLVGERVGTVAYFENMGTASNASFGSSPTIAQFGQVDVSDACCVGHSRPRWITDPALANGTYLMVGSDEKRIDIYEVPDDLHEAFTLADSLVFNAGRLAPRFVDLDQNGVFEMICGTAEGGVKYYTRPENTLIGMSQPQWKAQPMQVFPNPGSDHIEVRGLAKTAGMLHVMSVEGRVLHSQSTKHQTSARINLEGLAEGYYMLRFESRDVQQSGSFLILR